MEVIADSGAIYAIYDRSDEHYARISAFVRANAPSILIPAPLLGELGYMLGEWLGEAAVLQFLRDVEGGAVTLVEFTPPDVARAHAVLSKYSRLNLGLCDASVIAVADRLGINGILTVDRKHFRAVTNARGQVFRLLPWDLG